MRTKLREYSYLYLLAAASSISGVASFLRGSLGYKIETTIVFFPCLIIAIFASWKFMKIHCVLKLAEAEAESHVSVSQNQKIQKEFDAA
jgi:hypothetical protein